MTESTELVARSLTDEAAERFMERVESQARSLESALESGEMENTDFTIGLEMEVYAIDSTNDSSQPQLTALADPVFDSTANKELGHHNAEINTDPDVFDESGVAAQAERIESNFQTAQAAARNQGCELVLDAMWTVPPATGSESYLTATATENDVTLARHMRADPRYYAIDNDVLSHTDGSIEFTVPGVNREFPSILFESLATSIQPHLQIPATDDFVDYYSVGIRTLGPLLALSSNSPFLPPDLYTDVEDPVALVDETHHELRIAVFEQSVNTSPNDKVRVPGDIESAAETIDRVVEDDLCAPFLREWIESDERSSFIDDHWEFDYKRSTYWRWLRCVIGGDPVDGANDHQSLRIEYRPIPTQPTIRDVIGMQVLTVGLLRGLVVAEHPLSNLPWERAEQSFYAAVEDGLDADLAWITSSGERTTDSTRIFEEVFEFARRGLADAGLGQSAQDSYLEPIKKRWEHGITPSIWKKSQVRDRLKAGESLESAIYGMQAEYVSRSQDSETFVDWLDG